MHNNAPTWLEVALNGPWSRERQPAIPIDADEIVEQAVACAHEGAAIIHLHPYDGSVTMPRFTHQSSSAFAAR
jgi:uncharacterized protein (DUF849 family)